MNSIQKIISDEIVGTRITQNAITTYGYILECNNTTNTAKVNIFDKTIGAFVIYDGVPLPDTSSGVISVSPSNRTSVWIDFVGGNKNYPRISGVRIENYNRNTQSSHGGTAVPGIVGFFNGLGNILSGILGGGGRK